MDMFPVGESMVPFGSKLALELTWTDAPAVAPPLSVTVTVAFQLPFP
jgi:hypothetical protein